jgi:YVTN family beta-propeller protein
VIKEKRFNDSRFLIVVFATIFLASFGMLVQNAFADTVTATIPGVESSFIGVNPNTNKIYADNDHTFFVIDGSTNTVTDTIQFGNSSSLVGLGVNPVTNKIYVADQNSQVYVIDGNTNSIIANVTVSPSFDGVVANPNTNKIYVATGSVSVINGSTDTVKASGIVDCGGSADYLAVNPVTNKIYVPCNYPPAGGGQGRQAFIAIIDGSTDTQVGQINMTWNGQDLGGIAVNPNTNTLYQTDFSNNVIYVYDGNTNTLLDTIPASVAGFIAVNPVTNKVYATDGVGSVTIINGSTNKVIQTLKVGNAPWEVSVNTNTNKIYVANSESDFVSIIDGNSSNTSNPPSAPQNLQATAGNAQVTLSWSVPSSNGGSPITNYNVYRGTSAGTETLLTEIGNVTSYTDTSVTNGQEYFYKVTAVNSVGESPQSNEVGATPTPPGITLNGIQSTSETTSSSNQITLSNFDAGTGNNRLLVVGVSANNNNVASITFGGVQLTKKVSSFSNNDAEFWYLTNPSGTGNIVVTMSGSTQAVVGAYSFFGVNQTSPLPTSATKHNSAASSPSISITTTNPNSWVLDLPSIYGGVTLGSPTCTQQWDTNIAGAITGASSSTMVQSPGTVTCKWTASAGDLWDDVAIEVKASSTSSGTTTTAPSAPTGLTATARNSQVSLSWTAPSSNGSSAITGYDIYRGTTTGGEGTTPVGTASDSTLTYTDTGLTNGQEYFYKVTAVNSVGESPQSNEASATPTAPATAPSAPTELAATTASPSQINLGWTAPANNGGSQITGYEVERSTGDLSFGGFSNSTSDTFFSAPNATTFSDTGLASSTTYNYTVFAKNSVGPSSPSNTASATTGTTAPPPAGITLNNIQSTSGTTSSSNQITLANFNAGTGNDQLLVVGVSANNNDAVSVTFGGMSLTKAASSFYNNDAEFWYLKNPAGTGNIVVTMSGQTQAAVGAYSFSGVNQTAPVPTHATKHNTSASSPNISITTKYPNDWVLDLPSIYGGSTLGSPTCTQEWNLDVPNEITGASSSTVVQSPGAVTCKWTANSADLWDDVAIELRALG